MTRLHNALTALAFVGSLTVALPALAAGETKKEIQDAYTSYLDEQGFRPSLTELGNVLFKAEGRNYVIYVDEKDPTYFRLVVSFTYTDAGEEAQHRRLKALSEVNRTMKSVKAYVGTSGSTDFSIEMFQNKLGDANANLTRMLRQLRAAVSKYSELTKPA